MPETGPGSDFLKEKYNLHNAPEVAASAHHTEVTTGEEIPETDAEAQIQNYLDRYSEAINEPDMAKRERHIEAIKRMLHTHFVIKPDEIPDAYFEHQRQIAREQGHGDIEITSEMRQQLTEVIITDQETTLDNWVDYLSSEDATYPMWLKYYAIRSVLGMGGFDKERHAFSKRSKGTTKPFPDLNREALAYVLDAIEKKYSEEGIDLSQMPEDKQKDFQKLLSGENFAKLYAWAIEEVTPASVEQITITEGKWGKYEQGSDHLPLVQSLQGHGTGWCTAGESTAKAQLEAGDFYVYYSLDQQGQPTIPRAAIRMQGDQIGEVRGIAADQNLDPYIGEVVQQKMAEFPDGKLYEKKAADMKTLTTIDKKTKAGEDLTKEELIFLYEINSKIQGFGYQNDPRIAEIRATRNPREDAPIVFECASEDIAWSAQEIGSNTKAYVGEWSMEVFQKIRNYPQIEHLYESFPDKKIFMQSLETDSSINSAETAERALQKNNDYLSSWGKDILGKTEFSEESQRYDLVRFTVNQLGLPNGATTDEIYKKAEELGLELCPAEVGPHLRLQYRGGEWMLIAMKQIADRYGRPDVFRLDTNGGQLELYGYDADPSCGWGSGGRFVFRFRQVSQES